MAKVKEEIKKKAERMPITHLTAESLFKRTFKEGKKQGFFGKVVDPDSGKRYQIIGAVEIAS